MNIFENGGGGRILFLGEGNFSFSSNYIKNLQVGYEEINML